VECTDRQLRENSYRQASVFVHFASCRLPASQQWSMSPRNDMVTTTCMMHVSATSLCRSGFREGKAFHMCSERRTASMRL